MVAGMFPEFRPSAYWAFDLVDDLERGGKPSLSWIVEYASSGDIDAAIRERWASLESSYVAFMLLRLAGRSKCADTIFRGMIKFQSFPWVLLPIRARERLTMRWAAWKGVTPPTLSDLMFGVGLN
jgi:hypothetical protein